MDSTQIHVCPSGDEIRCWCCWEPELNHSLNPLIRVCLGCKDPQLQFVHQHCIKRFILHLFRARYPGGWIPEDDDGSSWLGCGGMPFLAGESVQLIRQQMQQNQGDPSVPKASFARLLWQWMFAERRLAAGEDAMRLLPQDQDTLAEQPTEAQNPIPAPTTTSTCSVHRDASLKKRGSWGLVDSWEDWSALGVQCTRCLDTYEVRARPVSSFTVLTYDRVLRLLMILMTVSILVLVSACSLIIYEAGVFAQDQWSQGQDPTQALQIRTLFLLGGLVDIRQWALGMITLFGTLYMGTWTVVLRHCAGYFDLKVLGKLTNI